MNGLGVIIPAQGDTRRKVLPLIFVPKFRTNLLINFKTIYSFNLCEYILEFI